MPTRRRLTLLALAVAVALVAGCTDERAGSRPGDPGVVTVTTGPPATTPPPRGAATVLAAGDVARCDSDGDELTAALLDRLPGTVLLLGDSVYDDGSGRQFADCYAPSWGRHRGRTRPAPGNHDYRTAGAAGYYDFFGASAGERGKGWYSFDLGRWHLVALNSNCAEAGGCQAGSEQERWLRADLAAHPARCTLAYWHHPRFSSGTRHGSDPEVGGLWLALYQAGADVVLGGHEHNYERFAPLDPEGRVDPARGIREFVVGTGGASHYRFGRPLPGSEARDSDRFGVLQLTLRPSGYDWRFHPARPGPAGDWGCGDCH
jgi:3',5'-cyclic AMP phosphodiesterase CpdA